MSHKPKHAGKADTNSTPSSSHSEKETAKYVRRHLRFGWWALLVFLTLGLVLEAMHGFKVGFYLDVSNETRRLMWTLAHAHGTLLALMNVAFGVTLHVLSGRTMVMLNLASRLFMAATILIPAGFFLGGTFIYVGDPGLGILLVPIGAILLFLAVFLTARGAGAWDKRRERD